MSRHWRTKEAEKIAKAVRAAGGVVAITRKGHLQVIGPKGTTIVNSDIGSWRNLKNSLTAIRRHSGLEIEI